MSAHTRPIGWKSANGRRSTRFTLDADTECAGCGSPMYRGELAVCHRHAVVCSLGCVERFRARQVVTLRRLRAHVRNWAGAR